MKGIILAGGSGTRLYPLTMVTSKQLLPVYDKPMIYYPLSILMLAGIRDILIISTEKDIVNFQNLLGDGKNLGISLSYKVQPSPDGLAQAFLLGEEFINGEPCALVLGDNLFYGSGLTAKLKRATKNAEEGYSTIFGYFVNNPKDFGVIEFDDELNIVSLEEKPKSPKSNYAATGLYFYNKNVVKYAKQVKPSARGELEITDLNNIFLKDKALKVELLGRGYSWMDMGTIESLREATNYVRFVEEKQGIQVAALEEISYYNGWITREELVEAAQKYSKSTYGKHLEEVLNGTIIHK